MGFKLADLVGWGVHSPHSRTPITRGDGCTGKTPYDSYAEAEKALGTLIRRGLHRPELGVLTPYACRRCPKHHLGHIKPNERE